MPIQRLLKCVFKCLFALPLIDLSEGELRILLLPTSSNYDLSGDKRQSVLSGLAQTLANTLTHCSVGSDLSPVDRVTVTLDMLESVTDIAQIGQIIAQDPKYTKCT